MTIEQTRESLAPEICAIGSTSCQGSTVTVEEIREILWPAYASLLDTQIQGLILVFSMYAKLAISQYVAEKREQMKNDIKSRSSW
jgi:hypothetical protein